MEDAVPTENLSGGKTAHQMVFDYYVFVLYPKMYFISNCAFLLVQEEDGNE